MQGEGVHFHRNATRTIGSISQPFWVICLFVVSGVLPLKPYQKSRFYLGSVTFLFYCPGGGVSPKTFGFVGFFGMLVILILMLFLCFSWTFLDVLEFLQF